MPATATLVISSGEQLSTALDVRDLAAVAIQSPGTLTGTITVQASCDAGSTYAAIYSDGADLTIPASKVVPLTVTPFDFIRVSSGSAEGGARTFYVGLLKQRAS